MREKKGSRQNPERETGDEDEQRKKNSKEN